MDAWTKVNESEKKATKKEAENLLQQSHFSEQHKKSCEWGNEKKNGWKASKREQDVIVCSVFIFSYLLLWSPSSAHKKDASNSFFYSYMIYITFNVDLAIFMLNMALILQSALLLTLNSYTHTHSHVHLFQWKIDIEKKSLDSIKSMKFIAFDERFMWR